VRRTLSLLVAIVATFALATSVLGAANPKGGLPTATFSGSTVTVTGGEFSGLGNVPAFAELTVTGLAFYECQNPSGHVAPGQNPVDAAGGTSGLQELPTLKNGRSTIQNLTASVTAPSTPTAQQVGCGGQGSQSWTVVLTDLTATDAHLVITHNGVEIFCRNYTVDGPATGTPC